MTRQKISITTKTGDTGETRLFSGELVAKHSSRPDAYGDVDELVSILGIARCHCEKPLTRDSVLEIQRQLFIVGSELATTGAKLDRLPQRIDADRLRQLEERMSALEAEVEIPSGFIVPGGSLAAGHLDLARTVARR